MEVEKVVEDAEELIYDEGSGVDGGTWEGGGDILGGRFLGQGRWRRRRGNWSFMLNEFDILSSFR